MSERLARRPGVARGKPNGDENADLARRRLERWRSLGATADVFFDFDWHEPATMPERCPRLRWIQATSAGIGGFMQRTGLDASGLTVTTAAGIHAVPLSEFAVIGAEYLSDAAKVAGPAFDNYMFATDWFDPEKPNNAWAKPR